MGRNVSNCHRSNSLFEFFQRRSDVTTFRPALPPGGRQSVRRRPRLGRRADRRWRDAPRRLPMGGRAQDGGRAFLPNPTQRRQKARDMFWPPFDPSGSASGSWLDPQRERRDRSLHPPPGVLLSSVHCFCRIDVWQDLVLGLSPHVMGPNLV